MSTISRQWPPILSSLKQQKWNLYLFQMIRELARWTVGWYLSLILERKFRVSVSKERETKNNDRRRRKLNACVLLARTIHHPPSTIRERLCRLYCELIKIELDHDWFGGSNPDGPTALEGRPIPTMLKIGCAPASIMMWRTQTRRLTWKSFKRNQSTEQLLDISVVRA